MRAESAPPAVPESLRQRIGAYEKGYQFGAALQLCHQGLREFPGSYELLNCLGRYLPLQGRVPEALQVFQRMLRNNPDDYMLASNLLFYRHYSSADDGGELLRAHREWCQTWTKSISHLPPRPSEPRSAGSKLRVGLVSPDFRRHPVASFLEPLLREMDRNRFHLCAYARSLKEDPVTIRLQRLVDDWRTFGEADLVATARKIQEDQVDILIDLAGHTPGQSLLLFASRPAPVQCTYLGYPDTTGLDEMDFRLVDPFSDPVGLTDPWNSEALVRLPETAWCYQPAEHSGLPDGNPAHLRNGYVTFGSFNALCKISDETLRWWGEILNRAPQSRLLVKNYALHDLEGREHFQRRALMLGFPIERLELLGALPEYLHFQSYRMVDIMLDAYPYHGTTTTCEALWMGVPVVTLAGKNHVSRVGASLLHQVNGDDLVATAPGEYISLAVSLANNFRRLGDLHHSLRQRMQQSPLMNAPRFARNFEHALEGMIKKKKGSTLDH